MTRSPALRPTRAPRDSADFCASLKRIAVTVAAGIVGLLITAALWIR